MSGPTVEVADQQAAVRVDAGGLAALARAALIDRGVWRGELSLLFVDEDTMADLNQRYLDGDDPTDVLAFPLDLPLDLPRDLPLDAETTDAGEATRPSTPATEPGLTGATDAGPTDAGATDAGPTDASDTPQASQADGEAGEMPLLLGDVVVCPAVAESNAAARSVLTDDELALLVVHGVLHVLGMDHAEPDEAAAMQACERQLLERWHSSHDSPSHD